MISVAKKLQNGLKLYIIIMVMTKRLKLIVCSAVLAIVAIMVGVCFVFLGNDDIRVAPANISVERYDDNYYLVAEYNANYQYRFLLEKKIEGEYFLVETIKSSSNSLKLADQGFTIVPGDEYRFSACYTTENDINGKMSKRIEWRPTVQLGAVNAENVRVQGETVSWDSVYNADSYVIVAIPDVGETLTITVDEPLLDLKSVPVGRYKMYITAHSNANSYLTDSEAVCVDVSRIVKNQITKAEYENGTLKVFCSQNATKFQVIIDGNAVATFAVEPSEEFALSYEVLIENCGFVLGTVDFDVQDVMVKSLTESYILESDAVVVINK